jgi:hypothetical protein
MIKILWKWKSFIHSLLLSLFLSVEWVWVQYVDKKRNEFCWKNWDEKMEERTSFLPSYSEEKAIFGFWWWQTGDFLQICIKIRMELLCNMLWFST